VALPVELFDQVAVGFSAGFELFLAVGQFGTERDDLLFEQGDTSFELVDVGGCAEPLSRQTSSPSSSESFFSSVLIRTAALAAHS